MRRLVIGDVHACYHEMMDLIEKAGLSEDDEIIALGDIIDRGPDPLGVLNFYRKHPRARSLMGNHERKHIRSSRREIQPALSQIIARKQVGEDNYPDAIDFLSGLPKFLDVTEALLIHGMWEPGKILEEQLEVVIVGTLTGDAYLRKRFDQPWYELYDGSKPIIVGHHDYSGEGKPFLYHGRVIGIDTGCCHGGSLTGILLPDFRIVSVPSRKDYWRETRSLFAGEVRTPARRQLLTWESAAEFVAEARRQSVLSGDMKEEIERVETLRLDAENCLRILIDNAAREHQRLMQTINAECDFAGLSVQDQGRTYSAYAGRSPLISFLHLARKGNLTLEELYKRFSGPSQVLDFAARAGLIGTLQMNSTSSGDPHDR